MDWTADWFDERKARKAVKGGHWAYGGLGMCRAADRHWHIPGTTNANIGFRLVVCPGASATGSTGVGQDA